MMHRRSARVCAVLSLVLLAGCLNQPRYESAGKDASRIHLTIHNDDFNDATVFANWLGGARVRVGVVQGKSTQTIPVELRGHVVSFDVEFLGGGGFAGESVDVDPGDHLDLKIVNRG